MFYTFRSTTEKLSEHLNSITQSGDSPVWPVHIGGRDWVIVCRKGVEDPPPPRPRPELLPDPVVPSS